MRILNALTLLAPLVLIGIAPASAQQPPSPAATGQTAMRASAQQTPDQTKYLQKAKDEMQEWSDKLKGMGTKAVAKEKQMSGAARNELDRAWSKTQAASGRLQTASAKGWEKAKASYESAS